MRIPGIALHDASSLLSVAENRPGAGGKLGDLPE
jgi:hypothetical protein